MRLKRIAISAVMLMAVISIRVEWIDVTGNLITNPSFDNNQTNGWSWSSNANSQTANYE